MKQESWVVDANDPRMVPRCIYCKASPGSEHNAGCVVRTRTVVIEATIMLVRRVPEDWDAQMIDFHMNDSSWCASNIIKELQSATTEDHCLCNQFMARYLREAEKDDHDALGFRQ